MLKDSLIERILNFKYHETSVLNYLHAFLLNNPKNGIQEQNHFKI